MLWIGKSDSTMFWLCSMEHLARGPENNLIETIVVLCLFYTLKYMHSNIAGVPHTLFISLLWYLMTFQKGWILQEFEGSGEAVIAFIQVHAAELMNFKGSQRFREVKGRLTLLTFKGFSELIYLLLLFKTNCVSVIVYPFTQCDLYNDEDLYNGE